MALGRQNLKFPRPGRQRLVQGWPVGPGGPPSAMAALHSPGRSQAPFRRQRAPGTPELLLPPGAAQGGSPPRFLSPAGKEQSSLWRKRTTVHTAPFLREAAQPAARLVSVRASSGLSQAVALGPGPTPATSVPCPGRAGLSSAPASCAPCPDSRLRPSPQS